MASLDQLQNFYMLHSFMEPFVLRFNLSSMSDLRESEILFTLALSISVYQQTEHFYCLLESDIKGPKDIM